MYVFMERTADIRRLFVGVAHLPTTALGLARLLAGFPAIHAAGIHVGLRP